jgi:uncharacterized protein (TIGR02466 family)
MRADTVIGAEHIARAFGTPVSSYLWPNSKELNANLSEMLKSQESLDEGVVCSNVGGWHSNAELLKSDTSEILELRNRIVTMARDIIAQTCVVERDSSANFSVDGWGNISRVGHYNSVHTHPGALWSGVYYVQAFEPSNDNPSNGKLEILDPRDAMGILNTNFEITTARFLVDPLPGLMVMFPGWLKHMVHPFQGAGERISISFNVLATAETGD